MSRPDLEYIRQWTTAKLAAGRHRRTYAALRQTLDAMLANDGKLPSTAPLGNEAPRKPHLRLVWSR